MMMMMMTMMYFAVVISLPLSATNKLLNTHDFPILLTRFIESPPWTRHSSGQLWLQCIIIVIECIKHTHMHTTVLRPSWILSRTTQVSWHQKGKTNLDLLEQEIVNGSGISWAICNSAP